MKKRLISLFLVLVLCAGLLPVMASAEIINSGHCGIVGDDLVWTLDSDGTLTISGEGQMKDFTFNQNMGVINGPWAFEAGKISRVVIEDGVTRIGDNAFRHFGGITTVEIPDSVRSIGETAFKDCSGLTGIVIPNGVDAIGDNAFEGCRSLVSVTIPASVKAIGEYAFAGCGSITGITIPDGVTEISRSAFHYCGSLVSVVIPDSVTSIGEYAFYGCDDLTGLILPKSLTEIGDYAFHGCESLTSVAIPDGVRSIGVVAFANCTALKSVTIPDSVTYFGNAVFAGCHFSEVFYGGSQSQWNRIDLGYSSSAAFSDAVFHFAKPDPVDPTPVDPTPVDPTPVDPGPQPATPFTDVPEGTWYTDAVAWAVELGITQGTSETTFSPENGCTRGQVVTFLWRANGGPDVEALLDSIPFDDVEQGKYYCAPVLWAADRNITNGLTDTAFGPDKTCTRGQVVTFLWRAAGSPEPEDTNNPFTDVKESDYFYKPVLWTVENGITQGTSAATFSPGSTCTRAHVVTFLYRAMGE